MKLKAITNLVLSDTHSVDVAGWGWQIRKDDVFDYLGKVYDYGGVETFDVTYDPAVPVRLFLNPKTDPTITIVNGDYVSIDGTDDSGAYTGKKVYPPAITTTVGTYYYIAADGSTYNDRWLNDLAKAVPTPSATPTPSVTPTATPSPAPVATPIADIYNGFDNFEFGTRKSGWVFSGIGNADVYLDQYYYGLNRPGLQLADDGDYFTSEALVGEDRELGYWMRGSGTGSDSYLSIDGRVYFDPYYYWSNVQEVKPLPQVETSTSGIEIMDDVLSLRFTYYKTTGELALDDFTYNAITPTVTPTPVGYMTPTPTPVGYKTPVPTPTPVATPSIAPTPTSTPEDQMYSIIVLPFQFKGTLITAD